MSTEQPYIDQKTLYTVVGKSGDLDKFEMASYEIEGLTHRIKIVTDYVDDLDMRKLKKNLKAVGIKVTGYFMEAYKPKTNVQNYYKLSILLWIDKIV